MVLDIDGHHAFIATSETPVNDHLQRLVFVHGAQNDHRVWEAQRQWFSQRGYMTFAPDLPGHGTSAGAPLTSIELMGQWLGKLLAAISPVGADEIASFVLIGHSMGSLAALECAAGAQANIAALILVGTAFPMRVSPALLEQTRTDEAAAIAQIVQWSHAPDLPDASSDDIRATSERLGATHALMSAQAVGLLHNDLNACNSYTDGLEAASKITCPSLVVYGSKDQMTAPKYALKLQAALGAENATIENAGHAMMSDKSDALCSVIHDFLSVHFDATKKRQAGEPSV